MTPEISHRCPSCGASTRDFGESVLFCPECGKPLAAADNDRGSDPAPVAAKPDDIVSASSTAKGDKSPASLPNAEKQPGEREERISARERTRETLQRASQRTRGAIEDNVKRVEKIHHVSSVVLEEASYDPSLRFVLVALGLFVLFVVLLILSKVMG